MLKYNGDDIAADQHGHTAIDLASHFGLDYLVRVLSKSQIYEIRPLPPRKAAQLAWLKTQDKTFLSVTALRCPEIGKK